MRHPSLSLIAALMLLTGITAQAGTGDDDSAIDYQAVQQKMSQTLQQFEDFTVEQKEEATASASRAMAALEKDIRHLQQQLEQQADEMSQTARIEKQQTLAALKERRAELEQAYTRMEKKSGAAWEEAVERFEGVYRQARDEWKSLTS